MLGLVVCKLGLVSLLEWRLVMSKHGSDCLHTGQSLSFVGMATCGEHKHGSDLLHMGQSFDRLCFYNSCLCLCMRSFEVQSCMFGPRCPIGCRQCGPAPAAAPAVRLVQRGPTPVGMLKVGRNRHPRCHHQPWCPRWHRWHRHRHLQCSLRQLQGRPRCRPRPRPRPLHPRA